MLTLAAILATTRQMAAYDELEKPPVPRDRQHADLTTAMDRRAVKPKGDRMKLRPGD